LAKGAGVARSGILSTCRQLTAGVDAGSLQVDGALPRGLSLQLIDAHQLSLHPLPYERRDGDLIFEERIQLRRRRDREPIALQFEEAFLISAGQGLAPGNLDVEDDLVALNVDTCRA
jgi:hypothetical protein